MNTPGPLQDRLSPLVYLANNPISLVGVLLTTTGGVAWLFTLPVHLGEETGNPYLGILTVFVLPAIFMLGLVLIPLGIRLKERKQRRTGVYPSSFPEVDWKNTAFRKLVTFVGVATFLNVIIGGHLTYSAVEHMESTEFCGESCHVMTPEFTQYKVAAHSQVACVECHIGEGNEAYVKAKLNGINQLVGVMLNTHPRPVPTPVHNLAQGALTCGKCHSDRDFGSKRREWIQFAEDEANSATRTELLIKIGGGDSTSGAHGAHMAMGSKVEYRSDPKRTKIPWIRYTAADGKETVYATADWNAANEDEFELRTMDCTDCHNRPAHSFENPGKAIDDSMVEGRISRSLPRIKQRGLQLIRASYGGPEEAGPEIREALVAFYQSGFPNVASARRNEIDNASKELLAIYSRNVFPEYNVEWGTYPNQMGHEDYPGCYRCHDTEHVSQDAANRPVGARCSTCHTMRVVDQPITSTSVTLLTENTGRATLPEEVVYQTPTGAVAFDHGQHVSLAKGDCTSCHNALFPMERAPLNYGANLHKTAEANKTSCAGCHAEGGGAFASDGNCRTCHTNLSAPTRLVARVTAPPVRLPGAVTYETSLGPAAFDHAEHVDLADGNCAACHTNLFPMEKAPLNYGENLHKTAEANKTSCAGCHVAGGEAFAADDNCSKCHADLGTPRMTPPSGKSGVPDVIRYATKLGAAPFDHAKHSERENGDCKTCHVKLFGLERGTLNYGDDIHRTAEANKTSCAACHVEGGKAFASKGKCLDCHTDLAASARGSEMGLPAQVVYDNRLGKVAFDHDQHILDAKGDCNSCHEALFGWRKGPLDYADDYHRTAEANKASCAGCHVEQGASFASIENCDRCHQNLELERRGG